MIWHVQQNIVKSYIKRLPQLSYVIIINQLFYSVALINETSTFLIDKKGVFIFMGRFQMLDEENTIG